MKTLRLLDVIHGLAFSMLLILPATLGAQTRPPIIEKIAKTYGLDSWDKLEAIRYTFHAEERSNFLERGCGSPRPIGSPMREKTRRASR